MGRRTRGRGDTGTRGGGEEHMRGRQGMGRWGAGRTSVRRRTSASSLRLISASKTVEPPMQNGGRCAGSRRGGVGCGKCCGGKGLSGVWGRRCAGSLGKSGLRIADSGNEEIRGQKSEVRGQKARGEDAQVRSCRSSEVGGRRSEGRATCCAKCCAGCCAVLSGNCRGIGEIAQHWARAKCCALLRQMLHGWVAG